MTTPHQHHPMIEDDNDRGLAPEDGHSQAPKQEQTNAGIQWVNASASPFHFTDAVSETVSKMPEIAKLKQLAASEEQMMAREKEFSREAADKAHEESIRAAAEAGTMPAMSLLERRDTFGQATKMIRSKIKALHREALPLVEKITARCVAKIEKLRVDAEKELVKLYSSRGLPVPDTDIITDHYKRSIRDLNENLRREQHPVLKGKSLSVFLEWVGATD